MIDYSQLLDSRPMVLSSLLIAQTKLYIIFLLCEY